ncbi:MAG: FAD-dependent oxidoreductase [Caldimonas sp.]|uniref:FAD-dependent oxidoreductase n=1 Tax=Caldimonas sp. TaxID=2838790 RepID=UPI00391A877F
MNLRDLARAHGEGIDYQTVSFDYERSPDQDAAAPVRHPVVVVGAGPVGMSLAIDLAQQGVRVVLLDNDHKLSVGSRAICFAKRTLEIFDRLGCGDRMVAKGVSWNVGKVFFRNEQIYGFNLLPESGHERPAFINLQQYYAEGYLAERIAELPLIDLRWQHGVTAVRPAADHVELTVDTPEGPYTLEAGYLIACDGSRSPVRQMIGQESHGRVFRDRFLIADVKMHADFPTERWFWFDPPFHPNQSVLLHRQPDDVWRIDFQLGWEADPEEAKRPENVIPLVKALLGPDMPFELEWVSVYTFSCLRMDRFRHGRVIFAGDSAHLVSPFGARGANSGVQDAENLAWKLAAVLRGQAGEALLDSYGTEREYAADENIRNSTRATDFITPKSEVSRLFRDAVLDLAKDHAFARSLVNSGRLSVPATLRDSPLNTPDTEAFEGRMVPGAAATDAPVTVDGRPGWLLRQLQGSRFAALVFDGPDAPQRLAAVREAAQGLTELEVLLVTDGARHLDGVRSLVDTEGLVARRYDARPGTVYLLRPDQHVCARWREPSTESVRAALRRALALH